MSKLSVVILAKNEEENLKRLLPSVTFADEIIVVDDNSSDKTVEVANSFDAIVTEIEWDGFGKAKQHGVNMAKSEWILSVDADEEISHDLADQIKRVISDNSDKNGYEMRRRTMFLGRWIYHCGWYPDYILRLFKKNSGGFSEAKVHEGIMVNGNIGKLNGEILHYSYPSLESYFNKMNKYTTLAAEEMASNGYKSTLYDIVIRPFASFVKHYILKRGFLDGLEGFLISVFSSLYVLVKYAKIRDYNRKQH